MADSPPATSWVLRFFFPHLTLVFCKKYKCAVFYSGCLLFWGVKLITFPWIYTRSKMLKNHYFIYAHQTLRLTGKEEEGIAITHPRGEETGGDWSPDFLRWWWAPGIHLLNPQGCRFLGCVWLPALWFIKLKIDEVYNEDPSPRLCPAGPCYRLF